MASLDIAHQRLSNQHIAAAVFDRPADVVRWLGAVQAQDYPGALWAVGLRTRNATEANVEKAIADKTIVRTWPMRGTLHFVAAEDVRWMLELLTPRVLAGRVWRSQQLGLDDATFTRSKELLVKALQGGRQLSRRATYQVFEAGQVSTAGGRGLHILSHLAHEGLICFGAREGRQPTFALLDEWVPAARKMTREEGLAELAWRYFTSHGPATLQDFVWWSGLRVADAKAGLETAKPYLVHEVVAGQTYWISSSSPAVEDISPATYMLPAYDEYTVAYKDRSAVLNPAYARQVNSGNGIFSPIIVVDGQVVATWKHTRQKDKLFISIEPFAKFDKSASLARAAARYEKFLNASVHWE